MNHSRSMRYFSLVTQLGVTMLTSILLCGGLGYFIDSRLGIHLWIFILFPIGVLSGFSGIFHMIKKMKEIDKMEEKESEGYKNAKSAVETKLRENEKDKD